MQVPWRAVLGAAMLAAPAIAQAQAPWPERPMRFVIGGSADLAPSTNTLMKDAGSIERAKGHEKALPSADVFKGRNLHFGIREHAMGAILSGIVMHGPTRAYGGTFMQFSDYMRPSVRLASLMDIDPIYVWTHDSIGLGEDGPTHQPVEHLAALRAMPNLSVVRPADANETVAAWQTILGHTDRPAALALTRQNVPVFPRGTDGFASTEGVERGGYVLVDAEKGTPDVVLIGTGSEVQLAVEARTLLAADGRGELDLHHPDMPAILAGPTAWVFGGEAHGLPPELAAAADHRVRVPIHGRAESLNLATAAAVGPIGATYLAAYAPAQHANLTGTLLVGGVHAGIGAATQSARAGLSQADSSFSA